MKKLFRIALWVAALLFAVQLVLAMAGPPASLTDWLRGKGLEPSETPRTIVVLGGGGMPSDSTLLRLYRAAEYGHGFTGAAFVVALPADGDPNTSGVGRMRDELVLRGIPSERIRLETEGRSTHEQAVKTRALLGDEFANAPLVVVSSGYHVRRAVQSYRAAGFGNVGGLAATNKDNEAHPGLFAWLRYGLWGNLAAQAEIMRELLALAAYKLRGWA